MPPPFPSTQLGGKGANLCEMARIGVNVPPGFTITTEECAATVAAGGALPPGLWDEVQAALASTEAAAGKAFGVPCADPLLLSVRSGAALSMPGMMDTVLNLGLNDGVVAAMEAGAGGDPVKVRWARDCYRRLLDMYGSVVLGLEHTAFEAEIEAVKASVGAAADVDLSPEDLAEVIQRYKGVLAAAGVALPSDPAAQLEAAIGAVFRSWDTPRAIAYRRINRITGLKGEMERGERGGEGGSGRGCSLSFAALNLPSLPLHSPHAPSSSPPPPPPLSLLTSQNRHGLQHPSHGVRQQGRGVRLGRRLHPLPI